MKDNKELRLDVENAIKWEPLLNDPEICVVVKDGIVTLSGSVDSFHKKIEIEKVVKKVSGVKALVEKIQIELNNNTIVSDMDIAKACIQALNYNWQVPNEKVNVKVENGWVTLEGTLKWNAEKDAAKKSIHHLVGVKGVTNNITIQLGHKELIEKKSIETALMRNWAIENHEIKVIVDANQVTLTGTVCSLYERDEASRIAWNTPGVGIVNNKLEVDCDY